MANWEIRYSRQEREWGTYAAQTLAVLYNTGVGTKLHGTLGRIEKGFYTGGGTPNKAEAQRICDAYNANQGYVGLDHR